MRQAHGVFTRTMSRNRRVFFSTDLFTTGFKCNNVSIYANLSFYLPPKMYFPIAIILICTNCVPWFFLERWYKQQQVHHHLVVVVFSSCSFGLQMFTELCAYSSAPAISMASHTHLRDNNTSFIDKNGN